MNPELILILLAIIWALCMWCLVESIQACKKVKAKIEEEMDDTEKFYHQ